MARTTLMQKMEVELTLSIEEAKYLRDLLQNPLSYDQGEEPVKEEELRVSLWSALTTTLKEGGI